MGQREFKGKSIIDFPDEYICFDVETTGLSLEYHEIIEISAVRVKNGNICEVFSSLVHPSESIPQFITNLTGITNEMAKHAPEPQSVLPRFIEFIGDNVLVGHNAASFDMNFVYDACEKCDLILKNDF